MALESIKIFYSYAHEDEHLRKKLETHLGLLRQQGLITTWHDRRISAGEEWTNEISSHLDTAQIILLLISSSFLASRYCYSSEMMRALERHNAGVARVIPIILRPVDWRDAPFSKLQALPTDGKPVTGRGWHNRDEAYADIAQGIRKVVEELRAQKSDTPPLFKMGSGLPTQNVVSPASPNDKNRAFMLQRLRHNYCDLMEQSLQGAARLMLGFAHKPGAVQNTTTLLLRQPNRPERLFPPGTSIQQVYKEANGELLILGEPGSGKSTQLYALALHLVEQADNDQAQPLPIVFSLSTWAARRLSLGKWMEEQLSSPLYGVPRYVSRQWVQNEQILPLLDGLDEMNEIIRSACIVEINAYHRSHLHPLVVCSRSAEYATAAASERIALQSAVVVQPLGKAQVETILDQGGKVLAALRAVYKNNIALQELATTPLILNLLILTYQSVQVHDLATKGDVLQQQLLTSYVQRMVELKEGYSYQQTCSWLHWLAERMRLHQQTVFILEQLQPDLLPQRDRALYHRSIRMVGGLLFGLIGALFGGLLGVPMGIFIGVFPNRPMNALTGGLLGIVLGGLLLGLIGLLFGQGNTIKLAEKLTWSWNDARWGLIVALPVGSVGGLFAMLIGGRLIGPQGGLIGGLFGGLLGGLFVGFSIFQLHDVFQRFQHEGYRHFLRNGALVGLLVGVLVGPLIGMLEAQIMRLGLVEGLFVGLFGGLAGGLIGGLLVGISNTQLSNRLQLPLRERHRSMRNRLLFGLLVGVLFGLPVELLIGILFNQTGELFRELLFGLVGGLAGGVIGGLISGFSTSRQLNHHSRVSPYEGYRRSKRYALASGVFIGLLLGSLFGLGGGLLFGLGGGLLFGLLGGLVSGLTFGLPFGLGAVIQHNTLRFQLWHAQLFPWNVVNFLENAQTRHLLLRVGGSYIFIHQLLLNYFADLDPESASVSTVRPIAMQTIQLTPPPFTE